MKKAAAKNSSSKTAASSSKAAASSSKQQQSAAVKQQQSAAVKQQQSAAVSTAAVSTAAVSTAAAVSSSQQHSQAVLAYCYGEDKRTMLSAAAQLTKELTIREMSIVDIVSFVKQFYATIPNSNCTWLTDDKTAQSIFKKHVNWLYWQKGIVVDNNNNKFSIKK